MAFEKELPIVLALAKEAAAVALKMQSTAKVYQKSNFSPVTDGDIRASEIICEGLAKHFPEDTVISEEDYDSSTKPPHHKRVWYVDPIDGTRDYVAQGDDYIVMIGLCINGEPEFGVMVHPPSQTAWYTDVSNQAIREEKGGTKTVLNINERVVAKEGPTLIISGHYRPKSLDEILKRVKVKNVISKGSVGLKTALITDNIGDLYMAHTTKVKLWDTCAPNAILKRSGGFMKHMDGSNLSYRQEYSHGAHFLATYKDCARWFNEQFPS